jgi:acetate kinase
MGFTPAGGLPMSTRSGDLDPGVAWVMMKEEQLSPKQFSEIINHESGLLAISGTSGDMQDLLKHEEKDRHAADAVDLFCYQVKKQIGAYAAVLGGVDFLVFSGGIGEHAPAIRARICEGLEFLGIELDKERNEQNAPFIAANESRVTVRLIPTDEELMIAETVSKMLHQHKKQ